MVVRADQLDVVRANSVSELHRILREQGPVEVFTIYASGALHFAWFVKAQAKTPEAPVKPNGVNKKTNKP